ncbi:MAG TPA: DUF1501 domain-containing protein [Kofleriaceae bacterium]|nr:DUF1501 domain-containing protein [Kofleriaceae bacterium]
MPTRRDIVKLALGTSAWLAGSSLGLGGLGGCRKRRAAPVAEATHPRYWVLVLLSGGHDTLYTTDPKLPGDVDSMVTLPANNKIASAGELRFGPHFAPLSRWASELTVLNGIQVRTVNHDTGQKQFFHLKSNIVDGMPSALDLIATRRDGQPLGVAYINLSARVMHSPAYFGTADQFYYGKGDIFEQVARSRPDELAALAKVLRRRAGDVGRGGPGWREAEQTAVYLREVADFFEKVATVPPLVSAERSADYTLQTMAESFDRALWMIEHDLCCGVVLDLGLLGWDTHIRNESKQGEMNGHFVRFFDEYLADLHVRKNRHGLLAQRTVTVVGSELGRFPHQNDMLGKDHLPQTSFLFAGPGIRAGKSFGRTGRRMEGLPIAYKNGDPADAGRVPLLDDVGSTLLHLAGLDPERYGYRGKVCDFLLDGAA